MRETGLSMHISFEMTRVRHVFLLDRSEDVKTWAKNKRVEFLVQNAV